MLHTNIINAKVICKDACMFVALSVFLSVCLSVFKFVSLSVCLTVCLCMCAHTCVRVCANPTWQTNYLKKTPTIWELNERAHYVLQYNNKSLLRGSRKIR